MNEIPVMDDPLGKHWEQPRDIREAPMDEDFVILTSRQVSELHEYSTTLPTGVYPGKCWQRKERNPDRHLLVWYGAENAEKNCPILFREIGLL